MDELIEALLVRVESVWCDYPADDDLPFDSPHEGCAGYVFVPFSTLTVGEEMTIDEGTPQDCLRVAEDAVFADESDPSVGIFYYPPHFDFIDTEFWPATHECGTRSTIVARVRVPRHFCTVVEPEDA